MVEQYPPLSSYLKNHQKITHRHHSRGWIESPTGIFFKPPLTKKDKMSPLKKWSLPKKILEKISKNLINKL
ncbi:phage filamentation protein Fil family protein (plasmid) [Pantoea sp. BJ2]|uniref:Phage filamentation protein Fil family protein n=1 Tax=Pantoea sp. BJ2 TaxID=3141322 RepID=A0AAU7U3I3_9GAMM